VRLGSLGFMFEVSVLAEIAQIIESCGTIGGCDAARPAM